MDPVMSLQLRKTYTVTERTLIEGGKAAPKPLLFFAAAAVLTNPWAGRGFVEDLKPKVDRGWKARCSSSRASH